MIEANPINQIRLFGLDKYLNNLIDLKKINKLPNKILLSGQKGIGKSTLVYHFINYILSKDELFNYDIKNYKINKESPTFKTILNKSNPNFILLDVNDNKKFIDVNQIRELILKLTRSSFNEKPRFVLIDNIENLNKNSINALLKILEEPISNTYFFLINNNSKKILPTLLSRCINFKVSLSNKESLEIANKLLNVNLSEVINEDLINHYSTPGNIFRLVQLGKILKYNLSTLNSKEFLKIFIKEKYYKKDVFFKYLFFDLIESYLRSISSNFHLDKFLLYDYFINKISNINKFNLDEDSLFIEFEEKLLNE
ncbi:AAA family ATPase [Candidatus Pelagibacter sp.]|nr:AAA family ATPase [Candidatus Pelagibacter sp.]